MHRKNNILLTSLVIASFFLSLTPLVSSGESEGFYPDLIVHNISVNHWNYNTKHTATITIKNVGNYDASEDFKLTLFFEIRDTQGGFGSLSEIKEWTISGLLHTPPFNFKVKVYTHTWDNPDPNRYEARFYAYVDSEFDVTESNENNNEKWSSWFN